MAARLKAVVGVLALAAVLSGCGIAASTSRLVTPAAPSQVAGSALSPALALARGEIVRALGTVNLILDEPNVPFRAPESPSLVAVPRAVVQVVLPDDPRHGYVTMYELGTEEAARTAAAEQLAYVTSGVGRVQFPPDTQFVVRRLATTVIFHAYSPENATDERAVDVVTALNRVGVAP